MFAGEFRVLWPQLISYSFFHRPVKSAINEKPEPNSTINKKKKTVSRTDLLESLHTFSAPPDLS